MTEQLTALIRKRGSVKSKLTNFVNYLTPVNEFFKNKIAIDADTLMELSIRVNSLPATFAEFDACQNDIELKCDEQSLELQYKERDEFINKYHKYLYLAERIVRASKIPESAENISQTNMSPSNNIKLPIIELKKFKGNPQEWLCFKDTYESLIHTNNSLNNIQKYHYLIASCEGSALQIIQSLEFNSDNYENAWATLCNRFNNNRILVTNHIKAIFELPALTKENARMLRSLIDTIYKNLRALKTLGQPIDNWDALIIHLISTKLDRTTACEWEKKKGLSDELPTLEDMSDFLKNRADLLETIDNNLNNSNKFNKPTATKNCFAAQDNNSKFLIKCNFCKNVDHKIYKCPDFLKLNVSDRIEKITQLRLCKICLCAGHDKKQCKASVCALCKVPHNRLLHIVREQENKVDKNETSLASNNLNSYVLLSTVCLNIFDSSGNIQKCRAILDSGSQSNFISSKLVEKLSLRLSSVSMAVNGINESISNIKNRCDVTIKSMHNNHKLNLSCLVLPKITGDLPCKFIEVVDWNIPDNITLADPNFYVPSEIDLLIGGSHFWNILKYGTIKLGKNMPMLQNTIFGYTVVGPINTADVKLNCFLSFQSDELNSTLKKFWEVEECLSTKFSSPEDLQCEELFCKTVSRNSEGRFIVRIPLKYDCNKLGDSYQLAKRRLLQLESRLENNPSLKNDYVNFINEYINMGHMEVDQDKFTSENSYFLCHHAVIKECSITTKLRVVFNGSAVTSTGFSLNNIQHLGPAIQNDLFKILLSFRQYSFVVSSDISKMYRQILVHPDDRKLQKILWRYDINSEIQVYTLNTVTYGTASAPYLAIRCLKQLAYEFKESHPTAADKIKNSFYVDDLFTGFNDETEAITICKDISFILNTGCFPLRKWSSNSATILNALKIEDGPISVLTIGDKDIGIQWVCQTDTLSFQILNYVLPDTVRKRHILSEVSKIYDPLGLIGPCIIVAKILLQKIWMCQIDWDTKVDTHIERQWLIFRNELQLLNQLKIERHVVLPNASEIQLHGFCDASSSAYSACIYIKSADANNVKISLLCSKTKVAPLKPQTIPRLELMSALLLAQLLQFVIDSVETKLKCFLWSDSMVALHWINTEPYNLQQFVGNRVNRIKELTKDDQWNYVNTKNNPADLASRGIMPSQLMSSTWFEGPKWLHEFDEKAHNYVFTPCLEKIPELKKFKENCLSVVTQSDIFTRYSNLNKLQRVVAYIFRFKNNALAPSRDNKKLSGPLSVYELSQSLTFLIKLSQNESFNQEYKYIEKGELHKVKNKLKNLTPFIDNSGIIRLKGRLKHSILSFETKHPALLDSNHTFTKLLFLQEHNRLFHAGSQLVLNTIRQNYWPLGGVNLSKKISRTCVVCVKHKPTFPHAIMGNLPEDRVTALSPFSITGVDYAGPFLLKDRKGRGFKTTKAYLCLFICFSVKAVHLEVVSDLSTDNFIACLRRFSARRGYPSQFWSDNGTNFVGASNTLNDLKNFLNNCHDKLHEFCSQFNMRWNFIPANSPHFGGLWESNIKNVKSHLTKVVGKSILTYEELQTFVVQVEAIVNSRPLHPLSSDPTDLQPLTPAHFLVGKPLVLPPDPNLLQIPINRLSRYQLIQQLCQSFWIRWRRDYLSTLQQRNKWQIGVAPITIGTMVIIKSDNLPPSQWLLGRVVNVHPGSDGCVRVASVKTARGIFKRPIVKMCALPVESEMKTENITK